MWMQAEEAAERLCAIAAEISGEETGDKERLAAELLVAEIMEYCHIERVPEGALWAAAEELLRRCGGAMSGAPGAQKVTLGDYSVQFRAESSDENSAGWKWKLRPWRKLGF